MTVEKCWQSAGPGLQETRFRPGGELQAETGMFAGDCNARYAGHTGTRRPAQTMEHGRYTSLRQSGSDLNSPRVSWKVTGRGKPLSAVLSKSHLSGDSSTRISFGCGSRAGAGLFQGPRGSPLRSGGEVAGSPPRTPPPAARGPPQPPTPALHPVTAEAKLVAGGRSPVSWGQISSRTWWNVALFSPENHAKAHTQEMCHTMTWIPKTVWACRGVMPTGLSCLLSADPRQEGTWTALTVPQAEINVTSDKCLNLSFLHFICKKRNTPTPNYRTYKSTCNYHHYLTLPWKF